MSAPLNHNRELLRLQLGQLHSARKPHRIRVTRRLGGTTDADIQDRERDNLANTGDC